MIIRLFSETSLQPTVYNYLFYFFLGMTICSSLLLVSPPQSFSLAAVNPDVYTGSRSLASAGCVPGVLSAVTDVRRQAEMAWPAGRAMLDGSAVSVVDRQACGSDLSVTGCQRTTREPPGSTHPLSSHLTTDRGEALNSQLATPDSSASSPAAAQYIHCSFEIQQISLSGKCTGVPAAAVIASLSAGYSNWMFAERMIQFKCFLPVSPLENVYLRGTHGEADKSYTGRRCKPVRRHNCHFITRNITAASDPLLLMGVYARVCIFTSNHSELPVQWATVWQLTFGAAQEMYMPFVSMAGSDCVTWPAGHRDREKILVSCRDQYSAEKTW